MSEEPGEATDTEADDHGPADLPGPARPKLRRRPLGYKRSDVDEAFEARDNELAELKQDIAALWLAFAQHDRMIRALGGETPAPLTERPRPESEPLGAPQPPPSQVEAEAESIGNQLSELDEVLAAIEMATQTLEKTYSEEIEASKEGGETEVSDQADAADGPADEEPSEPEAEREKG